MSGEVQPAHLQPTPKRRLDWCDPQALALGISLEPEQRSDHLERGAGGPRLRAAAVAVVHGWGPRFAVVPTPHLWKAAHGKGHPGFEDRAGDTLRLGRPARA